MKTTIKTMRNGLVRRRKSRLRNIAGFLVLAAAYLCLVDLLGDDAPTESPLVGGHLHQAARRQLNQDNDVECANNGAHAHRLAERTRDAQWQHIRRADEEINKRRRAPIGTTEIAIRRDEEEAPSCYSQNALAWARHKIRAFFGRINYCHRPKGTEHSRGASIILAAHAIRLLRLDAPESVQIGQQIKLKCLYDAKGDKLQSLSWYKNGREFYRYQPFERRKPVLVFNVTGVHIDAARSRNSTVLLTNTTLESSGRYKCEVTGSSFQEGNMEKQIIVIEASTSPANNIFTASVSVLVCSAALAAVFVANTWPLGDSKFAGQQQKQRH